MGIRTTDLSPFTDLLLSVKGRRACGMIPLDQITDALQKAEAKVKRLSSQLEAAMDERDELRTTMKVIERLSESGQPSATSSAQSDNGQLIYGFVGVGPENARMPKEIIDALKAHGHDLNADLVRTQLWRMEKRNELRKADGRYWKPAAFVSDEADNDCENEAPGAETSRASEDFGRVAELEGPEKTEQRPNGNGENAGSSPAPPSPIQFGGFSDDLDDDIPF